MSGKTATTQYFAQSTRPDILPLMKHRPTFTFALGTTATAQQITMPSGTTKHA